MVIEPRSAPQINPCGGSYKVTSINAISTRLFVTFL